ncbi:MBL fold metallo-hydrolase [Kineosporia sp. J2-2]|uniref:MBL fold metallo-hydrolase n=1 Tax=Kineosporia corallincola TaxID=2835133 RepID=A0ABS5TQR2_9ACTN|nr:MBL fold metallo-hydrolase [Kineosporia corallincola]MBT0772691.1 MBL fold metallo-hydrolase [Kineosporia corallincola]
MRITHIGHSCLLVETGGARILTDPGAFAEGFEDLTGLDAIAITHQHMDHLDTERLPALLAGNPQARVLAEPQTAALLRKVGVDVHELTLEEPVPLADARLTAVGGVHAEIHADIPLIGNVGLRIETPGDLSFFHPGDSYGALPAGIDLLAVPLNAPWAKFSETANFVRAIAPGRLFPIHDGLLQPTGRAVYLRNLSGLLPEGAQMVDLADAGPTEL